MFTLNMEENFRKNQRFITEMNTIKVYAVTGVNSTSKIFWIFRLKGRCKCKNK